jgi:ligand-binding sensor domain-containing protein
MILEDSRGVLWVATGFANRGGVAKMSRGQWSALTKRDGLAGWKVRSVFEDRQGRLWFGSEYDGVAVLSGGGWRVIPPSAGLAGREVKAVVQDEAGVYWLGTDSGLSRIPSI